ncbi:MAG TPA: hypothetical protein VLB76_01560 [Thermoanaerobaculia bacterium]|jgi:hypothetical protein|nr:hypothetical protein [Thermoanaerobaculia bacterium]
MNREMKRFWLLAVIGLASASGLLAQSAEKPLFILGTVEGRNTTDPRPAESTNFRTLRGGFQVLEGSAGYVVYLDIIKKPGSRMYTRAILQNPLDPRKPFVYEHFIDKDTPSTTVAHGPVKGLEIHKDYELQFVLYEDEARTKEVDRLTQLVRSYVDTTGPKLKISDVIVAKPPQETSAAQEVPERWKFNFDSRQWQLGSQSTDGQQAIREYIPQRETMEAWSELVTSYYHQGTLPPKAIFENMKSQLSKNCPSLRISIIEESATSILFEWRHKGCGGFPPQHEIKRIAQNSSGVLFLAYVAKTEQLSEERRKSWVSILREATLVTVDNGTVRKE